MIKLELIFTRPAIIPSVMGWYEGIGSYLQKEIGIGITEHVLFFQKGVLKSYRSKRQLNKVRDFIIKNPEIILKQLKLAKCFYNNLKQHKNNLTKRKLKNDSKIFSNFYRDYLASWRPNFFAAWAPELVTKNELKGGEIIFKLAEKTRSALDPVVVAVNFYKKVIDLIGKDKKLLNLCTSIELEKYLRKNLDFIQRKIILQRQDGWVIYDKNSKLVKNFKRAQVFIKKFGFILEEELKITNKITEFKGQVASSGKVSGRVKTLFRYEDNKKVKKGDILVSPMTTPAFMPAILKSSAIVTNEGGITCHAAIISRELNLPCIIGTKIATKVLKDGDLVEVDAERGVVKILKR